MPIEAFGRHTDTTRAPGRQHRHVPTRADGRTPVSGKTDTQGRGVVRASRAGRAESPAVGLAPLSPARRQLAAHRAALRARGDAAHYAPRRRCTLRAAGNHAASPATASCPAIHVIHAPRFTGLLPRDSRDAAAATTRRGAGQAPRALGRTSRSSSSSIPRFSGRITSCRERKGEREGGTERQGESEREPANPSGRIIPRALLARPLPALHQDTRRWCEVPNETAIISSRHPKIYPADISSRHPPRTTPSSRTRAFGAPRTTACGPPRTTRHEAKPAPPASHPFHPHPANKFIKTKNHPLHTPTQYPVPTLHRYHTQAYPYPPSLPLGGPRFPQTAITTFPVLSHVPVSHLQLAQLRRVVAPAIVPAPRTRTLRRSHTHRPCHADTAHSTLTLRHTYASLRTHLTRTRPPASTSPARRGLRTL